MAAAKYPNWWQAIAVKAVVSVTKFGIAQEAIHSPANKRSLTVYKYNPSLASLDLFQFSIGDPRPSVTCFGYPATKAKAGSPAPAPINPIKYDDRDMVNFFAMMIWE